MKFFAVTLLFVSAMFVNGCGRSGAGGQNAVDPVTRADGVASLTITANDQMKFDVTAFTVHSGETVRITFANVGIMPVRTMGHDLVILKQGRNYKQFAGDVGAQHSAGGNPNAIPEALVDQVIAYTNILGPGEKTTLEFKAPAPGKYEYLCTFPSHFVFMNGVMTVQ
jgi:azurin